MAKDITIEEIFEFSVRDIKLQDFCAILLGCADFLDGFLEYAKDHPKDEIIEPVLGEICQALLEFNARRAPFNHYVERVARNIMMNIPEVQELIANKYIKPKTIKS